MEDANLSFIQSFIRSFVLPFIRRAREPGLLTADEVYLMLAYLAEVGVALPQVRLSPVERKSIGALLFLEGPVLVDAVVDGVRRAPPGLFAEFGLDIEDLHGRTARGRVLRGLAYTLRDMAQRADDLAALDNSSAVRDALVLLRSGMVPGRQPGSIADRRRLYLRAAIYYWERWQARKQRAAAAARPRPPASLGTAAAEERDDAKFAHGAAPDRAGPGGAAKK